MNDLVNTWISTLCEKQGLGPGALDEHGQWNLIDDEEHRCGLYVPADSPLLFFVAEICAIPPDGREAFYAALLGHNLSLESTGGASFAINAADQSVWMNYAAQTATLDALGFENAFGTFLENASLWRERLALLPGDHPGPPTPASDEEAFSFPGVRI
jgi:hypothetical protein